MAYCSDTCSVCLDTFSAEDPPTITTCDHGYHLLCILEWSKERNCCPICCRSLTLSDPTSQKVLAAMETEKRESRRSLEEISFLPPLRTFRNFFTTLVPQETHYLNYGDEHRSLLTGEISPLRHLAFSEGELARTFGRLSFDDPPIVSSSNSSWTLGSRAVNSRPLGSPRNQQQSENSSFSYPINSPMKPSNEGSWMLGSHEEDIRAPCMTPPGSPRNQQHSESSYFADPIESPIRSTWTLGSRAAISRSLFTITSPGIPGNHQHSESSSFFNSINFPIRSSNQCGCTFGSSAANSRVVLMTMPPVSPQNQQHSESCSLPNPLKSKSFESSPRYKETISRSTRCYKDKLREHGNTMKDLGTKTSGNLNPASGSQRVTSEMPSGGKSLGETHISMHAESNMHSNVAVHDADAAVTSCYVGSTSQNDSAGMLCELEATSS